jgi:hypothetical protein
MATQRKKYTTKELKDWFSEKVSTAAGYRQNILRNSDRQRNNMIIGSLYFFLYDAKWKSILPVYDRFPLVFPIERYPDGVLGLNLHWLTYPQRQVIMDELTRYAIYNKNDDIRRLNLSYQLLVTASKKLNNFSRPCIRRYLFNHVRSRFILIKPDEWDYAISLPVEQFVYKK